MKKLIAWIKKDSRYATSLPFDLLFAIIFTIERIYIIAVVSAVAFVATIYDFYKFTKKD